MYFSAEEFNRSFAKLDDGNIGKQNLERTSSLLYFLATDMVQKLNNVEIVDLHKESPMRKMFIEKVSELSVIGVRDKFEYQANYFGKITTNDPNTMALKTGKNFLSTHIVRASVGVKPVDYPTRPPRSPILKLGLETENGRFGITKHENWKDNLLKYIEFRHCGKDTFPLIVFLLRNFDSLDSSSPEITIRNGLSELFTDEVVRFLMENAVIDVQDDSFSDHKWTIEDLDSKLFRYQSEDMVDDQKEESIEIPDENSYPILSINKKVPRNRIIYGAPGTGKSYYLQEEVKRYFKYKSLWERVTFYPNYTYSQFVGTYKPVPIYKSTDEKIIGTDKVSILKDKLEPMIDYQFVPGPFLSTLIKAIKNPDSSFVLIIEEINRADAAAVFGDAFQLLDRNEDGESEYSIRFNQDVMNYLKSQGISSEKIKLPSNFFIWATMNSADQGVTPLDTAFKRRWSFEYIPLNKNEDKMDGEYITLSFIDRPIPWNKFRKIINDRIKDFVPEDKLIGPFFLKKYELNDPEVFKNKLLLYLHNDVLRYNHDKLFKKRTFSDIVEDYDKNENIFIISEEEFLRSDK